MVKQQTCLEPPHILLPLELPSAWLDKPDLFKQHIHTLSERLRRINALAMDRNRVIDDASFGNLDLVKSSYREALYGRYLQSTGSCCMAIDINGNIIAKEYVCCGR